MKGTASASYVGTCPTTGKKSFLTKKRAKAVRRRTGHHNTRPYWCPHCNNWHLGRPGGKDRDWHRTKRDNQ